MSKLKNRRRMTRRQLDKGLDAVQLAFASTLDDFDEGKVERFQAANELGAAVDDFERLAGEWQGEDLVQLDTLAEARRDAFVGVLRRLERRPEMRARVARLVLRFLAHTTLNRTARGIEQQLIELQDQLEDEFMPTVEKRNKSRFQRSP